MATLANIKETMQESTKRPTRFSKTCGYHASSIYPLSMSSHVNNLRFFLFFRFFIYFCCGLYSSLVGTLTSLTLCIEQSLWVGEAPCAMLCLIESVFCRVLSMIAVGIYAWFWTNLLTVEDNRNGYFVKHFLWDLCHIHAIYICLPKSWFHFFMCDVWLVL